MLSILDLTRAYAGSLDNLLPVISQWCAIRKINWSDMVVFVRPDQRHGALGLAGAREVVEVAELAGANEMLADIVTPGKVRDYLQKLPSTVDQVLLLSYSQPVLILARRVTLAGGNIVALSLGALRREATQLGAGEGPSQATPVADTKIVAEAVSLIEQLVKEGWFTESVHQANLRSILAIRDNRYADKSFGQIGTIVEAAVARGLIERAGSGPAIYLKQRVGTTHTGDARAAHDAQSVGSHGQGLEGVAASGAVRSGVPSVKTVQPATIAALALSESDKLSERMESYLREQNLGPFARVRDRLYDELERVVGESQPEGMGAMRLVSMVVRRARASIEAEHNGRVIPWNRVAPFLNSILTKTGALIDKEGGAVAVEAATISRRVTGLAQDWRNACEVELVRALISRFSPTAEDLTQMAYTLYNNSDVGYDRVTESVAALDGRGDVKVDDGGHFVLASKMSAVSEDVAMPVGGDGRG